MLVLCEFRSESAEYRDLSNPSMWRTHSLRINFEQVYSSIVIMSQQCHRFWECFEPPLLAPRPNYGGAFIVCAFHPPRVIVYVLPCCVILPAPVGWVKYVYLTLVLVHPGNIILEGEVSGGPNGVYEAIGNCPPSPSAIGVIIRHSMSEPFTFPLMVLSTTTKITKTMKFLYHIYIGTSSQTN